MPRFLAARQGKWVERGLQALQSPDGRTVQPSLIRVHVESEDMRVIVLAHSRVPLTGTGINICVSEVIRARVTVIVMDVRLTLTVLGMSAHAPVVVVVIGNAINVLVSMVLGMIVETMGLIRVIIGEDQMGSVVKAPRVAGVVTVAVVVGLNLILRHRMVAIFLVRAKRKITVATLATEIESRYQDPDSRRGRERHCGLDRDRDWYSNTYRTFRVQGSSR